MYWVDWKQKPHKKVVRERVEERKKKERREKKYVGEMGKYDSSKRARQEQHSSGGGYLESGDISVFEELRFSLRDLEEVSTHQVAQICAILKERSC